MRWGGATGTGAGAAFDAEAKAATPRETDADTSRAERGACPGLLGNENADTSRCSDGVADDGVSGREGEGRRGWAEVADAAPDCSVALDGEAARVGAGGREGCSGAGRAEVKAVEAEALLEDAAGLAGRGADDPKLPVKDGGLGGRKDGSTMEVPAVVGLGGCAVLADDALAVDGLGGGTPVKFGRGGNGIAGRTGVEPDDDAAVIGGVCVAAVGVGGSFGGGAAEIGEAGSEGKLALAGIEDDDAVAAAAAGFAACAFTMICCLNASNSAFCFSALLAGSLGVLAGCSGFRNARWGGTGKPACASGLILPVGGSTSILSLETESRADVVWPFVVLGGAAEPCACSSGKKRHAGAALVAGTGLVVLTGRNLLPVALGGSATTGVPGAPEAEPALCGHGSLSCGRDAGA